MPAGADPAPIDHSVVAKKQNTHTYTVQNGDTLFGIATKFDTTWQHLAALNHLNNPQVIHPGQVLSLV